ncbi:unnamed protein product [Caenorhabditis auriculariae]|uniref:Hexosyltransferase n=1 Tax=Caenorhabditis auriculariae TaxID=2777116 RepID=A0A8S1H637_9PELO|nr:unnamed protein product [Caenorhabditis auriculariae]
MRLRGRRMPVSRPVFLAFCGILIGFTVSYTWTFVSFPEPSKCASTAEQLSAEELLGPSSNGNVFERAQAIPGRRRGLMLVAIMTAARYVDTRAYNVWKTWAQHVPGKVLFFVAEGTESIHPEMPLIRLKGVDDTYPPQKKSFAMVKWLAENMADEYDWFLRGDDDLYIRGEELAQFLRSIDSSRAHVIGQAGLGNTAEYGLLALGSTDNYCMGGPGVVMSRATLLKVSPHLETCLQHLLTSHEDVELGRCIRKHVGVACTWNYEMQKLFHNNQRSIKELKDTEELKAAITLHPIKDPAVMRAVHLTNREIKLQEARSKRVSLASELSSSKKPTLVRLMPNRTSDLTPWEYMNNNKILFCANRPNCPRHTADASVRADISTTITREFNANARQRGRNLQFQSLQYGYMRVEPRFGVDYVLDMILWFKKFRPPHRTTLSVRRHAYVQQTFGPLKTLPEAKMRANLRLNSSLVEDTSIHMIMPLRGRAEIFARFATHLKNVCQRSNGEDNNVSLLIVLYSSEDEARNRETIEFLRASSIPVKVLEMGDAAFSRGIALMQGAAMLPHNALLFFTDVDMLFTCDALHRIRLNTILNAQVYFPIVFSEFSPESWSENDRLLADAFHYGRRRGYFRHFGYGLAAMYKADLMAIGGFNTKIEGWGKEDVDLFEKVIAYGKLRVIRSPEPGLVHIYHPIHCPETMKKEQLDMCRGSKAASLASIDTLVEQVAQYS